MSKPSDRRSFLKRFSLLASSAVTAPLLSFSGDGKEQSDKKETMKTIKNIKPLGFQWETADPFLFCVHHEDDFPEGNEKMGPADKYHAGRHLGDDFIIKDGFRMYHGKTVPGFPGHPHRGFETVTVVRKGIVDHADSTGASGRYGNGDVQWMTAGKGVQHSEMFPLIKSDSKNPMELFQIWLNLPKASKMVEPHFKMLWRESIPNIELNNTDGKGVKVEVIAGELDGKKAPTPPPNSWAADPTNEVGIWNIKLAPNASFELPKASAGINRTIYFYEGEKLAVAGELIPRYHAAELNAEIAVKLEAGNNEVSILVLQGRPIGEPVIQYGPFVMNTKEEIQQAFNDYHRTQFGGWPWPKFDQVHSRELPRFAKHSDGTEEVKNS